MSKKQLSEKNRNGGQWTEARYQSFIKSALRRASTRWGPVYQARKDAEVGKRINKSTGRMAMHFECACCSEAFPAKQVAVDHIDPIIDPAVGFTNWDETIERMFCEAEGLQVLCKECHDAKTKAERAVATERRRKEKTK